jgi:hypothetical protein
VAFVVPSLRRVLLAALFTLLQACVVSGQTPAFGPGVTNGVVRDTRITEASGIVASRQNPGVLWTHNDSGFPGTVFALQTNGAVLALCTVPNTFSGDFEDIAIGPGPLPDMQYIYLGDIGDNFATRSQIRVLQIPEPAIYSYQSNAQPLFVAYGSREIVLTYPDGAHDAESLMIDPRSGDLFVATKETNSCNLYQATRAQLAAGTNVELTYVEGVSFRSASAGDISSDGSLLALRRSNRADVWQRRSDQTVSNAFLGASTRVPVIGTPLEPNGEGIGFDANGQGYYTISEGFNPSIYYFPRTDSGKPREPITFVPPGASWQYLDDGTDQGIEWRAGDFDDSFWFQGAGQFGYGQGDEQTQLYAGYDLGKITTTYFRNQFSVGSLSGVTNIVMRLCFNDGIAVYLNGQELWRRNLAADATFDLPALADRSPWQNIWWSVPVDPALLVNGVNTLAVEVHRFAPDGPDLSFDLQLVEGRLEASTAFSAVPQRNGDTFQLPLSGQPGRFVGLEGSLDLVNWELIAETTLDSAGKGVLETSAANSAEFYRIQSPYSDPKP